MDPIVSDPTPENLLKICHSYASPVVSGRDGDRAIDIVDHPSSGSDKWEPCIARQRTRDRVIVHGDEKTRTLSPFYFSGFSFPDRGLL